MSLHIVIQFYCDEQYSVIRVQKIHSQKLKALIIPSYVTLSSSLHGPCCPVQPQQMSSSPHKWCLSVPMKCCYYTLAQSHWTCWCWQCSWSYSSGHQQEVAMSVLLVRWLSGLMVDSPQLRLLFFACLSHLNNSKQHKIHIHTHVICNNWLNIKRNHDRIVVMMSRWLVHHTIMCFE